MVELVHQVCGQLDAPECPPDDRFLDPLRGVIDDLHNMV